MTITTTVTADDETTTQTETLSFAYDASGAPQTVTCGNTTYLYITNLQGDVVAILDDAGNPVVQYSYDAWGNLLGTTGSLANTLGADNPLRYRGYVYDTETELYYLQSRYYDPEICRFINADSYTSTGQGLLGNNMFAYCQNNPIMYSDPTGTVPWGACLVVAVCVIGVTALDHHLAANQPEGGYCLDSYINSDGSEVRKVYAEGNGFTADWNGITLFDIQVGLLQVSGNGAIPPIDNIELFSATATAECDWSVLPKIEVFGAASMASGGIEITIPFGIFDITFSANGYLGGAGGGFESDLSSGEFKITPPFIGIGGTYGIDIDLNWWPWK